MAVEVKHRGTQWNLPKMAQGLVNGKDENLRSDSWWSNFEGAPEPRQETQNPPPNKKPIHPPTFFVLSPHDKKSLWGLRRDWEEERRLGEEERRLGEEERRLGEEERRLGEEERRLGEEERRLGEEERRLGEEERRLGKEERRLGEEERRLGEEERKTRRGRGKKD